MFDTLQTIASRCILANGIDYSALHPPIIVHEVTHLFFHEMYVQLAAEIRENTLYIFEEFGNGDIVMEQLKSRLRVLQNIVRFIQPHSLVNVTATSDLVAIARDLRTFTEDNEFLEFLSFLVWASQQYIDAHFVRPAGGIEEVLTGLETI